MVPVPRKFPNSTIVCIGGGPSLLPGDVAQCRGVAHVIAVNDAIALAPWADVLYSGDREWWGHRRDEVRAFAGLKYRVRPSLKEDLTEFSEQFHDVHLLAPTGHEGVERDPAGLRIGLRGGQNSGYQAMNLAVHLGASRILLLGYDMQEGPNGETHWFGDQAWRASRPSPYKMMVRSFDSLVDPLKQIGIDVINCSRRTALTQFQRLPIERMLSSEVAA